MTTKTRITVPPNTDVHGPLAPKVQIIATSSGMVTFVDRLKSYYKAAIAALGAVLVLLNELTPAFDFLPGQDKQYVTTAIVVLTAILTALKSNEHWVDDA